MKIIKSTLEVTEKDDEERQATIAEVNEASDPNLTKEEFTDLINKNAKE